jgi:SAM-dependent methyltransferase
MSQSVERFSSRVENYIKYRPGYPSEVVSLLESECDITPESTIVDLGSGTGKLAEIFLQRGYSIIGVEPNPAMREAGEKLLAEYSNFTSIEGTAENTTLPDSSVDLIIAGQAFHWFDPQLARAEAARILRQSGWVALVWNDRKLAATPFLQDYEALLLKYGNDYNEVRHDRAEGAIYEFFFPQKPTLQIFANSQTFDFTGLKGRVLSSSYTPEPDHPNFQQMMLDLKSVFDRHQHDGHVIFNYDTKLFYGRRPEPKQLMREERRSNKRFNSKLEVKWEWMAAMEARLDDISMGGCFINTMGQVDPGEVMNIQILMPSGEWLGLRGEVTSFQPGIGFGLAFSSLTEEQKEALASLLSDTL